MDMQAIENAVDLRMAQAKADAEKSSASAKIKILVRKLTLRAAILLFVLGLTIAISPVVLEKLLLEDKMAGRLTPAAIGTMILAFSATILVTTNLMRKVVQRSFRRSLILSCICVSIALLAGSGWLYFWLVAHNAAGSHHLIWVGGLIVALGVPSGWLWSYRYRRINSRQRRIMRDASADWRALRKWAIQNEIDRQQHNARMAKWDVEDTKWKTANAESEQLKYRIQYMKG